MNILMDSSYWFDTINLELSIVYILFLSLKNVSVLANSVDLDEVPPYFAFHLALH